MTTRSGYPEMREAASCGCSAAHRARWFMATLACGCFSSTWGQPLADPGRPPQAWLTPPSRSAGTPGTPGTPGAAEPERPPQLQSVLIGPSRKYAIIDGQLLGVGDTFKDARVVAVTSSGVKLSSERGNQTLSLFPDVQKRPVKPAVADAEPAPVKAKRRVRGKRSDNEAAKENK